ncbi:protein kinase domain-containing protein [Ramlibacter albus]|uniref:non-specific serine/threonine protein kinase n=1 Tax=Ramlibacter albus TaxID=2079448 RepID=A0A923MAS3_9BURK|nr:protein kinase [Ramlibacter albus]MBC5767205.1 protein kinase [Ramlibacter albus]
MEASTLPTAIGKYQIEKELGRGASSVVYLARDPFNQRSVALKQVHAHLVKDEIAARRMRRSLHNEAVLAGTLKHPHIIRLYDADEEADPPYLVLEYVEGTSLASHTAPDKLLPVAQVLNIAFKVCSALEHAQKRGLVHRDIKPANIMLQPDGEVKLADFGTALSLQGDTTQLAGIVGSPSYMSPEQVKEETCTHHSDMFSLAVVMYELLTSKRPFEGDSDFATLFRISTEDPVPPTTLRPDLPEAIDAVILKALQKKPGNRYAQWSQMADALLAINCQMPARRAEDRESERFTQLRDLKFFSGFQDNTLWEALRLGTLRSYGAGTSLMVEGAKGESFYILLEGEASVSTKGREIAKVGPGVTLGEMAYLQPENPLRSATAKATSNVLALEIRNDALRSASDELQNRFDKAFIQLLMTRLVAGNERV